MVTYYIASHWAVLHHIVLSEATTQLQQSNQDHQASLVVSRDQTGVKEFATYAVEWAQLQAQLKSPVDHVHQSSPSVLNDQKKLRGAGKGPALWLLGWSESQQGRTHGGRSQLAQHMAWSTAPADKSLCGKEKRGVATTAYCDLEAAFYRLSK